MIEIESVEVIAAKLGVTAEVMQFVPDHASLFAAWDAEQRLADAELGASPFETRSQVGL